MSRRTLNVIQHLGAQIQIPSLEVNGGESGVANVWKEIIATTQRDVNDCIFDSLCGRDNSTAFTEGDEMRQTPTAKTMKG
jgi:hypothetical protein